VEETLRRRPLAQKGMVRPVRQTQRSAFPIAKQKLRGRGRMVGPQIALLSRLLFPFEPHFDTIQLSRHLTRKYLKMTVVKLFTFSSIEIKMSYAKE
jgi:hypothetical protein